MHTLKKLNTLFRYRFGPVLLLGIVVCSASLLTRIALLLYSSASFEWGLINLFKVFFTGLLYDLAAASYAIIPLILYLGIFPSTWYGKKLNKSLISMRLGLGFDLVNGCTLTDSMLWPSLLIQNKAKHHLQHI